MSPQLSSSAPIQSFIQSDGWLANILKKPVYRLIGAETMIALLENPDSEESIRLRQLQAEPCFIYTKLPTTDLVSINRIVQWNFRLIDANVVFERPILRKQELQGHCDLKFTDPNDEAQTVSMSKTAFSYSRFHLDPQISTKTANQIKAEWVRNYFLGKRGQYMTVALIGEKIVGFLQLLQSEDLLTIDLIDL